MKKLLLLIAFVSIGVGVNAQAPQKRILFEKITSAGCGGCGYGDFIIDSIMQTDSTIIPVHIHWHNATHIDSLTSAHGDSILADYLLLSPSAMVDRKKFGDVSYVPMSFLDDWHDHINQRYNDTVFANVWGSTLYDTVSRGLQVTVEGEFLQSLSGDIRVNAYVLENEIIGSGPGFDQDNSFHTFAGHPMEGMGNPMTNYHHHSVLRKMLGGPRGEAGVIPSSVNAGHMFTHTFNSALEAEFDHNNVEIVVLIQLWNPNDEMREIINANVLELNDTATVTNPTSISSVNANEYIKIYPNPANSIVKVEGLTQNSEVSIYDLNGRLMSSFISSHSLERIDVSSLSKGIYSIRIQNPVGTAVRKLVIQ